jgi:hypothetical protein
MSTGTMTDFYGLYPYLVSPVRITADPAIDARRAVDADDLAWAQSFVAGASDG